MFKRVSFLYTGVCLVIPAIAKADGSALVLYPLTVPPGFTGSLISGVIAGETVGGLKVTGSAATYHAFIWNAAGSSVDLTPAGYTSAVINATDGTQRAGYVGGGTAGTAHAFLWNGAGASGIDLTPVAGATSKVFGVHGGQQVGNAYLGNVSGAALWSGSADSLVMLDPNGFGNSIAYATDGHQQVGSNSVSNGGIHAMMWTGTAASAVDLTPNLSGTNSSASALGVGGGQQVGYANLHATLWTGSAASAVDLQPANLGLNLRSSVAQATNGQIQVGYVEVVDPPSTSGGPQTTSLRAVAWSGTAGSAVDLSLSLPTNGAWTGSEAISVDDAGNIFGIAFGTVDGDTGIFAVEWDAAPEPSCALLLTAAVTPFALGRRRHSRSPV